MRPLMVIPVVLLVAAVVAPAQEGARREGSRWVRSESGAAPMSQAESLRLLATGNVALRGGAANELRYTVRFSARESDQKQAERILSGATVSLTRQGGTILLNVDGKNRQQLETSVELTLPRQFGQVAIESGGGRLSASGFHAQLLARTGGGQVELDALSGKVNVETAGGVVKLGKIQGAVYCFSGGGTIEAEEIGGDAVFETGGGNISLGVVTGQLRASTNGGQIFLRKGGAGARLRTSGGEIKVLEAGGEVVAGTGGGGIRVSSSRGAKVESGGGPIFLEDVLGPIRAVTAMGSITARLAEGAPFGESTLTTSRGDITVYIPAGLQLTVRAQAASSGSGGRIQSEFAEVRPSGDTPWPVGRSEVTASINGGGPVLRLVATDGTIYLRKSP